MYGLIVFTIGWVFAMMVGIILQCTPVQYFWNREIAGGHCMNANAFYFAMGVISTVVLVAVLFLPVPILCMLQVSSARRVGLASVFTIGVLYVHPAIVSIRLWNAGLTLRLQCLYLQHHSSRRLSKHPSR